MCPALKSNFIWWVRNLKRRRRFRGSILRHHFSHVINRKLIIFTGRNEVVAKVMFLLVSVILSTGGVSGRENPLARRPPWAGRPPRQGDPPGQGDPPARRTPPPGGPPRHTVNERPVRILLECILVVFLHLPFV